MAIRVTCIGCHTRFDVSEKFAGKEGPCPKCKKIIKIPDADEQVVVHAPEHSGPKDSKGQAVLKPISRSETNLSGVQITLIICTILGFLIGAFVIGLYITDKENFPVYILAIGAVLLAGPAAFVAYTFLRNQESTPFVGKDLWSRLGICTIIYSALWLIMPLMGYAFPGSQNNIGTIVGLVAMIAAGGTIGMLALEFDYLFGILHYGMYLVLCLVARIILGVPILPGAFGDSKDIPSTIISMVEPLSLWLC